VREMRCWKLNLFARQQSVMARAVVDTIFDAYTHPAEVTVFQGHRPWNHLISYPRSPTHRNQDTFAIPKVRRTHSGWKKKKRSRNGRGLRFVPRAVDEYRLLRVVTDSAIHPRRMEAPRRSRRKNNRGMRQHHEFERYAAAVRICPLYIQGLAVQIQSPWPLFSIVYSHSHVRRKRHCSQICRNESLQVPHTSTTPIYPYSWPRCAIR
jgi:hypothetical protein